ncbi:Mlc titration factor MtfA (ptsG expression regulator) [Natronospira proteinivora]|uniref:Mlc titration factor MtfA (PtsG expression regulator) n=1 Tax=Natronospira proteinivora TaxID=1807133 RepID=A0ABT1G644_9GAMM|nr:M90 family metallopeptidase [Natronospira proteinivora]MCP1726770.1 Mlc titration factor MtfA (ptsG expression regulator) [Natronospira proteinivora]
MFGILRRWREDYRLKRLPVNHAQWESAIADWPVARRYQGAERERLKSLSLRFILRKQFESGGGLHLDDAMQLRIATMAVVPILELGLDWYEGWYSVIVYPAEFIPQHEYEDDFGVVHRDRHPLSGEAWGQGPVILSWEDVQATDSQSGYNVVIHELAHKLDMLADGPNGSPPLHKDMDAAQWQRVFTAAWASLQAIVEADDREPPVDPYALENPGEFFSVVSETFFEAPERLKQTWPEVYEQLRRFYRQDPVQPSHRPGP